jgi:rod shape-determining protein MreC
MALLNVRERAGHLLLAVVVGHVVLISAQIQSKSGVPVLEAVAFGVFAEVQRTASNVVSALHRGWSGYVGLRNVHTENDELKRQIASLQVALQEQRALADRTRGLEALLGLQDRSELSTVAAEIIAAGATPDFRTVTIDKGSLNGVKSDMAVIAPAGIVGRVVVASPRAAKVQLLIDRNAAAGAIDERSRAQGIAIGGVDGRLRMEFVSEVSDIQNGDTIVTSGIDGIYPKGFPVGVVQQVEKSGTAYKQIVLKSAADFSGLEQVLVVLTPPPGRDADERGRGADLPRVEGPKP